jgi:hypothetical protein
MNVHRDRYALAKNRDGKLVGPWALGPNGSITKQAIEMGKKGLALDTPIPTVAGWSTMGQLQVGDRVFDMHGKPTTVTAVSEVKHIDCYRVTFANGASIVCDGEHYWLANTGSGAARKTASKGWGVYQIADLYAAKEAGKPVVMPVVGALDTDQADLLIDPWLLGYWLGNGAKDNAHVTCHADHVEDVVAAIKTTKYTVGTVRRDPRSQAVGIGVRGLRKDLAELGLLGHKHIPPQYMRASPEQRLALLSGLLDSDGHLTAERGRVHFASVDKVLADAVAELARSLGEVVHANETDSTGFGRTVRIFTVGWQPTACPVTIRAKAARFRQRKVKPYRGVKAIERIPSVPTRCIEVDSETRTYAAGVEMVPTHNTMIRGPLAKMIPATWHLSAAGAIDDGGVREDIDPTVEPVEATVHPNRPEEQPEADPTEHVRESVTVRQTFPTGGLTGDQDREISRLVRDRKMSRDAALDLVEELFGERKSARQLSEEQAAKLIKKLEGIPLPTVEGEVLTPGKPPAVPAQPATARKPSKAMLNKMHALLAERGITDDDAVRAEISRILGTAIASRKDLAFDQAAQVLDHLEAPDAAPAESPAAQPAPGKDGLVREQIVELIRAEWARAGGAPQALEGAFRKAMNVGHREAATNELNAFLQQFRAGKHQPATSAARKRAVLLDQIIARFDQLDEQLGSEERLRDMSRLINRPVRRLQNLANEEAETVLAVLDECKGLTLNWDAAITAAEATWKQQPTA